MNGFLIAPLLEKGLYDSFLVMMYNNMDKVIIYINITITSDSVQLISLHQLTVNDLNKLIKQIVYAKYLI